MDNMITLKEAAEAFDINEGDLYELTESKNINSKVIGGKIMVDPLDVDNFLDNQE